MRGRGRRGGRVVDWADFLSGIARGGLVFGGGFDGRVVKRS